MASRNIKGITIEIEGKTQQLQDALSSVDKQVYGLNNDLKSLNQALKLDPKNTELLAQKQDVLARNITATKDRLETLKEAQRQMGDYASLTDEQKTKYNQLSVEIAKGENALKGMQKELRATAGIDVSKLKEGLKKVGDVALDVSKKLANATAVVGSAVAGITIAGVKSYAELEQNVGGVETLFGKSAEKVIQNSSRAFETAGVSANEYMQGVMSFSASLIKSVGKDTDKAAKLADQAFIDMSDNANKFGTDMSSVQSAFQGFAKQNYNMLDNLKLGYGGNKSEMERLLKDAQKISGVKYDIKNLSDVYEAIHVIQKEMGVSGYGAIELQEKLRTMSLSSKEVKKVAEDMGITYEEAMQRMKDGTLSVQDAQVLLGTTAKEGATTISGSINMMKGAFDNFLNGSGSPEQLGDAMLIVMSNVATAFSDLLPKIASGLQTLATQVLPTIVDIIWEMLPFLLDTITQLLQFLFNSISQNTKVISDTITMIIKEIINFITANLPALIQAGISIILALVNGIVDAIPTLAEALPQLITTILNVLIENIPAVLEGAIQLLMALVEAIPVIITELVNQLPTIVETIITTLLDNLPMLLDASIQLFMALVKAIPQIIIQLVKIAPTIITSIVKTLWDNRGKVLEAGKKILISLKDGIVGYYTTLWGFIKKIPTTIKEKLIEGIQNIKDAGKELISGLWNGIQEKWDALKDKVKEFGKGVVGKFKKVFGIKSPSKVFKDEIGQWLGYGIEEGFIDTMNEVSSHMAQSIPVDALVSEVNSAMSGLNRGIQNSINPQVNPNITFNQNYQAMANAMKDALSDMEVELDDREVGRFVSKTITDEVYGGIV